MAKGKSIVHAERLIKRYGTFEAVRGLSFDIFEGECVGLLGPNGAGKTTTMRLIMGLSTMSGGVLTVLDSPPNTLSRQQKKRIGLVPQEDNLDPDLSVRQNLETYARYYGVEKETIPTRVDALLGFMQLTEKSDAKVNMLSGGMKRRLVIARALVSNPDFIILDEPTTGLDPQARVLIWKQLLSLKEQGKTLLLTTHYMDEAQRLCDRIILVDEGKVLGNDTPQNLIKKYVKNHVVEMSKPLPEKLDLEAFDHEDIGDAVLFYVENGAYFIAQLPKGDVPYHYRPANLEDVFLRLTGRSLRGA